MREANPGSHTSFERDSKRRFIFLFISFGQSLRGFYAAIRKVIVVDGTFLKRKYKGVLLVATSLDENSNLYPISFGVVDSENDLAWNWFMRQLNVVIADEHSLAFVSDRSSSIAKAIANVYPGKGVAGLVSKASKAYRAADFRKLFTAIYSISPEIGNYLIEADVRKWALCQFLGYMYDISTTNHAESINSALRTPREFPVILLLDSIREMMTRWFSQCRTLSSKHSKPLTIVVEKKIDRRIEKHAIKAGFSVGIQAHTLTDDIYTTASWHTAYEESINLIGVPEDAWTVPSHVEQTKVLPPKSRRAAGRRKKRRYETAEDKIRSSQGNQGSKGRKCSRCGIRGHDRRTCDRAI
ncbi:PREDICTED: uncharacterized protein LOC106331199 [Brassica oleracea var. oleracea]|uniref:uncharacterized protein LOC106331199 n=1 Tax=Brassica oleracea var. oleracea TaxID=109376 RepID=UPI0006A70898|nr:PREDICTED: uncharacterized protein LOC106331199 [Brassica oleracea var. oleracea]